MRVFVNMLQAIKILDKKKREKEKRKNNIQK